MSISSPSARDPKRPTIVGAVAYDPKAVTIWEVIREYFGKRPAPIDYRLFSNYEAQIEALFAGEIDVGKHGDTGASELEVVRAVAEGQAEAGMIGAPTWARLISEGATHGLTAMWTSPPYSHCNFTALPSLDKARTKPFIDGLIEM